MKRRWKILVGSICAVLLVAFGAAEGAYRSGLGVLTALPEAPPTLTVSEAVVSIAWLEFEGAGPVEVNPTGPIRLAMSLALGNGLRGEGWPAAVGQRIAAFCAMHMIRERRSTGMRAIDFHLGSASLSIWLSRNWSAEEIATCVLSGRSFGNGFESIDAAAKGYFNKSAMDLSHGEAAVLMVAMRAPSRYDPICNPAAVHHAATVLIARMAPRTSIDGAPLESIIEPPPDLGLQTSVRCADEDPPAR